MVWRGDLRHIKTAKRILVDLRDLDGWIDREKVRGVYCLRPFPIDILDI